MAAPTYQLTMRSGPTPGKTFPLDQEEQLVGRDLANDIPISDPEVSRRHARFLIREGGIFVEDLGSTNGSFLNGERVSTPQQLRVGDVVTLGESIVLIFERADDESGDATVGLAAAAEPYQQVYTEQAAPQRPAAPEQMPVPPQAYQQSQPKPQTPAVRPQQTPELAEEPEGKKGLPSWMIILIVAIVVLVCIIAVTMWFMPASWWCAIDIFNLLAGCPVP